MSERRISRLARHDDRRRAQGGQGGRRGRRPGQPRPDRDQGHRAQGTAAEPGGQPVLCGLRRIDRRRLHPARAAGEEARGGAGAAAARLRRARQGLAHRPYLRNLEAMLIVTDGARCCVITGAGDVLEPEHGVAAIGSGGNFALAAARALIDQDLDAEAIARRAIEIAADICVYTNGNVTVESLDAR